MLKRLFWLVVGFGLGLGSSWALMRRLRRVATRYAPAEVVERWGRSARATGDDLRVALVEGRAAMRSREAELRARIDGPGTRREPPGTAAEGQ